MRNLKLGENVELLDTGHSYSSYSTETTRKYIKRYKPINAKLSFNGYDIKVYSGYGSIDDLARKCLKWKIRAVLPNKSKGSPKYIIGSNCNHMLIISEYGVIKK